MYKKHLSSKFSNAFTFTNINNNNNIKDINNEEDKKDNAYFIQSKMSSESKKSQSNKNVIFENELEESIEDEEQKAAIDRLNRAFEKFGKENVNNMN